MKKSSQRDFFEGIREHSKRTRHGGGLEKEKRKLARPFRKNKPLHIVLKSSRATGKWSLRSARNKVAVDAIIETHSRKVAAKIHAKQNVGNHIHLLMSFKTKALLTNFLKAIASIISRHVTQARKGHPVGGRFWDEIPFSRIVDGLRDFQGMLNYILKNRIEADYGRDAREAMEEFEKLQRKLERSTTSEFRRHFLRARAGIPPWVGTRRHAGLNDLPD